MKEMTPSELIVYLYIMSNCDDIDWAFSPIDIENKTGITDRSIRNAKNGLKKKGYWDENGKIFHQYKESGKNFLENAEKDSEDSGKIYRTNNICPSDDMTKDNIENSFFPEGRRVFGEYPTQGTFDF